MAVRTQPTLSPDTSARVTKAMTLSPSSFRKRYKSSYETPSPSSSPTSSPTLLSRKRYQGTFDPIEDTEVEDTGLETEREESEDEDPGSESEEAASEDRQQQAVLVKGTTADELIGLGYEAARRCALELAEGTTYNKYEVGQSSRSVPFQQISDKTTLPRLPIRTIWEDPMEDTVYMDIECDIPPVRAPVQTPALPEWSSGSLLVSPASLTIPTPVVSPVPAAAVGLRAWNKGRSRLLLLLVPYGNQSWPLRLGQDGRMPREQLCGRLGMRIRGRYMFKDAARCEST
ncbi:hypothetical protein Tco_1203157 [Tanacetum coccineum]